MEIKYNLDIKTVKRAMALLDMDIPSDEEIETKMKDLVVDLTKGADEDSKNAELGFALIAIGQAFDDDKGSTV